MKSTPIPWKVTRALHINGGAHSMHQICDCTSTTVEDETEREANADFIVRAVNSHDELLAALKSLHEEIWKHHKMNVKKDFSLMTADAAAIAAIKKAGGVKP